MRLDWLPFEWAVTYPVHPDDPIGTIRRESDGFQAWLGSEDLGVFAHPDRAVEQVWERYLEHARLEHELASRTHGGYERSGRARA